MTPSVTPQSEGYSRWNGLYKSLWKYLDKQTGQSSATQDNHNVQAVSMIREGDNAPSFAAGTQN